MYSNKKNSLLVKLKHYILNITLYLYLSNIITLSTLTLYQ